LAAGAQPRGRKRGPAVKPALAMYSPMAWAAWKCWPMGPALVALLVQTKRGLVAILVEVRNLQPAGGAQPDPGPQERFQNRAIRFVPVNAAAKRLIEEYLVLAGHGDDGAGPLFRPVKNNRTAEKLDRPLDPASVYRNIVRHNIVMLAYVKFAENNVPEVLH